MDGVDITDQRPNQRNIGMVFQSYALFPNMTVAGNIGFGLKVAGRPAQEIQGRVAELLQLIRLEQMGDRYPWQLSGGQQQRVALARALAIRPKLLLLDEPLSALDAKIRIALRNEIRAIQRQLGITTIYVTHDQEEALSLSDRVVVMNLGRIEQDGSPFEIYNFPKTHFVASFVGTLNLLPAQVIDAANGRLSIHGRQVTVAQALTQHANGDHVSVAIRPELLSLDGDSTHDNRLEGQVENITFLGAIVRLQLRVDGTPLTLDEFNNPHLALPPIGATVPITFPSTACLVLNNTDSTPLKMGNDNQLY
jgi:putative spermidine/putrescine transport system ATP-binding protein